jgi:hypothetical protein
MRTLHEEPPRSQSQRKFKADDYEYILVQVTNLDTDAGDDKSMKLRRDGWEMVDPKSDPERDTGVPGYFFMRKPREDVQRDRQARRDQFLALTQTPLAQGRVPEGAGPHGRPVTETVGTESLTPQEDQAVRLMNKAREMNG